MRLTKVCTLGIYLPNVPKLVSLIQKYTLLHTVIIYDRADIIFFFFN